eukprot:3540017-Pleurochrysis_carterae.AAC.1
MPGCSVSTYSDRRSKTAQAHAQPAAVPAVAAAAPDRRDGSSTKGVLTRALMPLCAQAVPARAHKLPYFPPSFESAEAAAAHHACEHAHLGEGQRALFSPRSEVVTRPQTQDEIPLQMIFPVPSKAPPPAQSLPLDTFCG